MNTIPVRCPKCNALLQVPEQFAGQRGRCVHCQGDIQVPAMAVPVFEAAPVGSHFRRAVTYGFGGCLGVALAVLFVGGCISALGSTAKRNASTTTSPAKAEPKPILAPSPVEAAEVYSSPVAQPFARKDRSVQITENGNRYHRPGCRALRGLSYTTSSSDAQMRGLSPCRICNP